MSKICYGLAGSNGIVLSLPNYGPCNLQAGNISLCCEVGQTCLTNGLCMTQSGSFYNGGCTDNTYQAAICPKFCISGDAHSVVKCPFVKGPDFCCSVNETNKTCCETASNGLGLNDPVVSAQAVSAIGTSNVPTSISIGTTRTSSAGSSEHTRFPNFNLTLSGIIKSIKLKPILGTKIRVAGFFIGFFLLFLALFSSCWIGLGSQRSRHGHRAEINAANNIELDDLRAPHGNEAPQTQGTVPVEAEGLEANAAEPDADPTQTPPHRPQNPLAPPPYAFARPPRDGTVDHRRARVRPASS